MNRYLKTNLNKLLLWNR